MKFFFTLFIFAFLYSCQQKKNENRSVALSDSIPTEEIKKENKQIGDTLFLGLKNNNNQFTTEGFIDSLHTRIYVKFHNDYSSKLIGRITTPQEKANIRFNQIIFPDKTSDGPFGKDLDINIEQKGDYVLVVGHSQMAENPYWGKFELQLENKKID